MKKYKINVPDDRMDLFSCVVRKLFRRDEIIEEDCIKSFKTEIKGVLITVSEIDVSKIPKSWLTEIKEEPKTFDEWLRLNIDDYHFNAGHINKDDIKRAFNAGLENGYLKHRIECKELFDAIESIVVSTSHMLAEEQLNNILNIYIKLTKGTR